MVNIVVHSTMMLKEYITQGVL